MLTEVVGIRLVARRSLKHADLGLARGHNAGRAQPHQRRTVSTGDAASRHKHRSRGQQRARVRSKALSLRTGVSDRSSPTKTRAHTRRPDASSRRKQHTTWPPARTHHECCVCFFQLHLGQAGSLIMDRGPGEAHQTSHQPATTPSPSPCLGSSMFLASCVGRAPPALFSFGGLTALPHKSSSPLASRVRSVRGLPLAVGPSGLIAPAMQYEQQGTEGKTIWCNAHCALF